jgi:hypothetical protein
MKDRYDGLAKDIMQREEFKKDYEILFKTYIQHLVGDTYEEPSIEIGLRLSRSAQILVASGVSENIEIGIRIIDMFLELAPSYLEDILIIAEAAFSFLGNFPNVALINERWSNRPRLSHSFNYILTEEMHKIINTIESLRIDTTDFQVDLWNNLQDGNDVVTIAPTSTGKSYIIMQYIIQSMINAEDSTTYAVYIVPSRALIYEVSKKIHNILSEKKITNIEVVTIAQKDKEYKRKTIFVLTQERMLMLLHFQVLMRFGYIVIDEAQNIAEGSRGVLLHIVLSNVISRGPVQLIFSTPSINYQDTFNSLLGSNNICTTNHSPVSKNYIFVKCQARDLVLHTKEPEIEIRIPKNFYGSDYYKIIKRLGAKSNNIIYSNTKLICQRIVKNLLTQVTTEKAELYDAADYIKKTVHEKYSLAEAIKKGIVFHYGPLPRNIRIMIENYVEERLIDYVVCTSTLAEGVNMPAQNLFIRDPKTFSKRGTPPKPMSPVQFNNIIGRAGRLMKHFSGNVFYVDYEKWDFTDSLEEKADDHKLPTYFKILKENIEDIINTMRGGEGGKEIDVHTLNATVNKILQDEDEGRIEQILEEYVDAQKRQQIIDAIKDLRSSIEVPRAILNLNPTVGIVQQNNLYKYLYALDDIQPLKPRLPHDSNFYSYLRDDLLPLLIKYDIFQPDTTIENKEIQNKYYSKICIIANSWVRGVSLKEIIQNSISAKTRRSPHIKINIDKEIRDIVALIDKEIRFRLANAIKCFCEIYILVASQKGEDADTIPEFYSFLEIGASDNLMIGLISIGLSRQTAIEICQLMKGIDIGSSNVIDQIKNHSRYARLHRITQKEIESLHL